MSEYGTKGAQLVCTGGTAPSTFYVKANTLLHVQGNAVGTTSDKIPNTNIMPFGSCTMQRRNPPCMPAPTAWVGFLTSVQIPGGNPLLNTSTIQCACGGKISFQNSGQMRAAKVILNPDSPQIRALRKAAQEGTPFCEECEKKKRELKPKIINIYWMDEEGEMRTLGELKIKQKVTLCIDVEDGWVGKTVDLTLTADEGKVFETGSDKKNYNGLLVESDNTAYIDDFMVEYKNKENGSKGNK